MISTVMYGRQSFAIRCAVLLWFAMLIAPAITLFSSTHSWDLPVWVLPSISCIYFTALLLCINFRRFILTSSPLIFFGFLAIGADFLRNINLLEMIFLAKTYTLNEIKAAAIPYAWHITAAGITTIGLARFLYRSVPDANFPVAAQRFALTATVIVLCWLPATTSLRAWPATLIGAAYASITSDQAFSMALFPYALFNPRQQNMNWGASRLAENFEAENFVLVIGESVRSDSVPGCGGRDAIWEKQDGILLYCDTTSGSSSTHTSVPLLISRDMPGEPATRVSTDASISKAFADVGFETFWLSVQEEAIAWSDAKHLEFAPPNLKDSDSILPMLEKALASPAKDKFIIIHTYNAHFPYTKRYNEKNAPFYVSNINERELPTQENIHDWRNAYDNAVSESLHFLDKVISRLEKENGQSFVVYTSDHGENLLDDDRKLFQHALRFPTRWDTKVPTVIWANQSWRQRNQDAWLHLMQNQRAPIMHMDITPTLLGAAGINYIDKRTLPVNLTKHTANTSRVRIVQKAIQQPVSYDLL